MEDFIFLKQSTPAYFIRAAIGPREKLMRNGKRREKA